MKYTLQLGKEFFFKFQKFPSHTKCKGHAEIQVVCYYTPSHHCRSLSNMATTAPCVEIRGHLAHVVVPLILYMRFKLRCHMKTLLWKTQCANSV